MSGKPFPCLWFNGNAEEAVDFYLSVFKDGKILDVDRYTDVGEEITGHGKGDILTIEFKLRGQRYLALNAGPEFAFNPSISFVIECKTQREIDHYWERLSADKEAEQCGWLRDRFGISWQIVPSALTSMLRRGTDTQRKRVTEAFMGMKKLDIEKLKAAHEGA